MVRSFTNQVKVKAKLLDAIATTNLGGSVEAIRTLCPTRLTVRVAAIQTILKQFPLVQAAQEEVVISSREEIEARASGLVIQLSSAANILGFHIALAVFELLEEL